MAERELEALYLEAQSALKARDYDRAAELLKQILREDHEYRDVSRMLAETVKLRRRRWYNHPFIWSAIELAVVIMLGFIVAPYLKGVNSVHPLPTITTIRTSVMLPPTAIVTATEIPPPTPTLVPLTWRRLSLGQGFERDSISALAADKSDPDVIYAAMQNSGVYKTIDGGLSWRPAHQGLASTQVQSLLIDSQNPRILYAVSMGGIFKTEDGGGKWFRISDGTHLLMDMQDNSHLYAHDENGIYETTDQGNSWTTIYTLKKDCPDEIRSWAVHPTDGKMLIVGSGTACAGVYQSNDGARAWKIIGMQDRPNIDALVIGMDEPGNTVIFANFPGTSGFMWDTYGWYSSYDGGATWSIADVPRCGGFLVADPEKFSTLYCGDTLNLHVSKDGGITWRAFPGTQSMVHTAIHIDHLNGTDRILIGANDVSTASSDNIGIFLSEDGGISWAQLNNGLGSTRMELKTDPRDDGRIYLATYFTGSNGAACRLYRSLDNGNHWSIIKWRGGEWCGPSFDANHVIYMKEIGTLQISVDSGETWEWDFQDNNSFRPLPSYYEGGSQSVSANPYVKGFIYDVGDVIYYSAVSGASWQLSVGSEDSWDARLFYTDQSQAIYAIGRYHQTYSVDNGKTWQDCGKDVNASRSDSRLALDLQGSRLYLATPGQGILISEDGCQSWQASNEGLGNLFVNTLAIDPNSLNKIYAGTDGGAYISFNSGETWSQINDGLLGATVVYSIVVDKDRNVYAATPYGIFKLEGK